MARKIIDLKTISTSNEESDKNNAWYPYSFNGQVEELLKNGYVPYDQVQVSFAGSTKSVTGGENSGRKYLTQQFVKYEKEPSLADEEITTILANPTPDWRIGKRFTYKSKYGPSMFVGEIKEVVPRNEIVDETYIRSTTGQAYKLSEINIQP